MREISLLLTILSLIIVVFGIERDLFEKKTKYLITILSSIYLIIITILSLLIQFPVNIFDFPYNIINLILILMLPVLYGYIAIISSGTVRKNAIIMIIGLIIMFLGAIGNYENAQYSIPQAVATLEGQLLSRFLSVSMIIAGILILIYAFHKFGKEE